MVDMNTDSLSVNRPDLIKEWDNSKNELKPNEVSVGSSKRVWWICSLGREWEDVISHRTKRNNGCPYCSGHRVWPGFNDLATTHPDIIKEWDYQKNGELKPTDIAWGSNKKVWWKWGILKHTSVFQKNGALFVNIKWQL